MVKVFVPYIHNVPAALEINGHKVLIICADSDDIVGELDIVGGDEIRELVLGEGSHEQSELLADLAADIEGGVVLSPPGVPPSAMINNLRQELPWIH